MTELYKLYMDTENEKFSSAEAAEYMTEEELDLLAEEICENIFREEERVEKYLTLTEGESIGRSEMDKAAHGHF